jgi:hypothetical protein
MNRCHGHFRSPLSHAAHVLVSLRLRVNPTACQKSGLRNVSSSGIFFSLLTDIEQPLTQRNLINLAHILPKQSKDVDLHLVETFNEVVNLTVYAHPDPMNPFEQLENPA